MNYFTQLFQSIAGDSTIASLLLVFVATLVFSLVSRMLVRGITARTNKTQTLWDDALIEAIGLPLLILIWVVGIGIGLNIVMSDTEPNVIKAINSASDLCVITLIVWFVNRFILRVQNNLVSESSNTNKSIDKSAVQAIAKLMRLCVLVAGVLVAMQTLGFSIAGVLTFGGIGGIAIGFAAKDLLSNFFGGLMIYFDRPFSQGEWIRSPDREIEGTVESIGWRITQVRNFDSRPLYIPNSAFSTITLENVSRMTNRRIYETIGIRYDDASAMEAIVQQTKEFLQSHDGIDQNQTLLVNFTTFAPSSMDFFIYCFTKTQSGAEFNQIKQDVLLKVLEIVENNNAECAFPTTTTIIKGNIEASK